MRPGIRLKTITRNIGIASANGTPIAWQSFHPSSKSCTRSSASGCRCNRPFIEPAYDRDRIIGESGMKMDSTARALLAIATVTLLPGCVARTAWDVATVPVKAGGKVGDLSTTSKEEADRNRGKDLRK